MTCDTKNKATPLNIRTFWTGIKSKSRWRSLTFASAWETSWVTSNLLFVYRIRHQRSVWSAFNRRRERAFERQAFCVRGEPIRSQIGDYAMIGVKALPAISVLFLIFGLSCIALAPVMQ